MLSHRGSRYFFSAAFTLAAALFCTATASAALIIVNDTWRDGTRTDPASPTYSENGTDTDADLDLESAWFRGGAGTFVPVAAGGPLRGTGYAGSSASWTTYFTPEGSELNLGSTGSKIKVTWVFTPTTVNATNTSQNLRLALVNSPAVARVSSEATPGGNAYTGYGMFMNMGQTLGNANPFALTERIGTTNLLSAGADWQLSPPLANGATTGNHGYDSGTQYTFMMTIERTALGQLQIDVSMKGGTLNTTGTASVSFLDTTPNGGAFKFDTFALRPSNNTTTADTFDTSLFKVEYTVPEPTTFALLGIAGFVLVGFARRHR